MGGILRVLLSCIICDAAIAMFFPTEEKKWLNSSATIFGCLL